MSEQTAWYVDSLDALGGRCFAAYRATDLEADSDPNIDLPAVLIAAPTFRPELVGSRALAFGAAKGRFQMGLFDNDGEIAFPTLDALVEFVRRCFLSGGGGDGAGGRGPLPPPTPPETDPEFPLLRLPEGRAEPLHIWALLEAARPFHIVEEDGSASEPIARSLSHPASPKGADLRSEDTVLVAAGVMLMTTTISSAPKAGNAAETARWFDSFYRLGGALQALGLWPRMLNGPYSSQISVIGNSSEAGRRLKEYFLYWPHCLVHTRQTDPFDDLSLWLMPKPLAAPPALTVADHLTAIAGSPGRLLQLEGRAAWIALLAACHLLNRPSPGLWNVDDATAEQVRSELIKSAYEWLIAQLPRTVFRRDIERMISDTATL